MLVHSWYTDPVIIVCHFQASPQTKISLITISSYFEILTSIRYLCILRYLHSRLALFWRKLSLLLSKLFWNSSNIDIRHFQRKLIVQDWKKQNEKCGYHRQILRLRFDGNTCKEPVDLKCQGQHFSHRTLFIRHFE